MNTFLISNDFSQCARVLDHQRLSRQICEIPNIFKCLNAYELIKKEQGKIPFGIQFPSVLRLWTAESGTILYPELHDYFKNVCQEWKKRTGNSHAIEFKYNWKFSSRPISTLEWTQEVYDSHRSQLLFKDFHHYSTKFRLEKLSVDYHYLPYSWDHPRNKL